MTTTINTDAQIMAWRPELIRLTFIPLAGIEHNTPCWLDPQAIMGIRKGWVVCKPVEGQNQPSGRVATCVMLYSGPDMHVEEEPDEIARLRNKAFGFEPPKPKSVA